MFTSPFSRKDDDNIDNIDNNIDYQNDTTDELNHTLTDSKYDSKYDPKYGKNPNEIVSMSSKKKYCNRNKSKTSNTSKETSRNSRSINNTTDTTNTTNTTNTRYVSGARSTRYDKERDRYASYEETSGNIPIIINSPTRSFDKIDKIDKKSSKYKQKKNKKHTKKVLWSYSLSSHISKKLIDKADITHNIGTIAFTAPELLKHIKIKHNKKKTKKKIIKDVKSGNDGINIDRRRRSRKPISNWNNSVTQETESLK